MCGGIFEVLSNHRDQIPSRGVDVWRMRYYCKRYVRWLTRREVELHQCFKRGKKGDRKCHFLLVI